MQQSRFLALVGNIDYYKQALDIANNAEDTGALQMLKVYDSLESRIERLRVSVQEFYTGAGLQDLYKEVITGVENIINTLNRIPKTMGKFPTKVLAFGLNLILTFKRVLTMFVQLLRAGSTTITAILTQSASNTGARVKDQAVRDAQDTGNAVEQQYRAAGDKSGQAFQQGFTGRMKGGAIASAVMSAVAAVGSGISINGMMKESSATSVEEMVAARRQQANGALLSSLASFAGGAGLAAAGQWPIAIMSFVSSFTSLWQAIDAGARTTLSLSEELTLSQKDLEQKQNDLLVKKDEVKQLQELIKKTKELEKAQYDSADAYQQLIDYRNQIADQFGFLVDKYDQEGNAVLNMGKAYEKTAQSIRDYYAQQKAVKASQQQQSLTTLNKLYKLPVDKSTFRIGSLGRGFININGVPTSHGLSEYYTSYGNIYGQNKYLDWYNLLQNDPTSALSTENTFAKDLQNKYLLSNLFAIDFEKNADLAKKLNNDFSQLTQEDIKTLQQIAYNPLTNPWSSLVYGNRETNGILGYSTADVQEKVWENYAETTFNGLTPEEVWNNLSPFNDETLNYLFEQLKDSNDKTKWRDFNTQEGQNAYALFMGYIEKYYNQLLENFDIVSLNREIAAEALSKILNDQQLIDFYNTPQLQAFYQNLFNSETLEKASFGAEDYKAQNDLMSDIILPALSNASEYAQNAFYELFSDRNARLITWDESDVEGYKNTAYYQDFIKILKDLQIPEEWWDQIWTGFFNGYNDDLQATNEAIFNFIKNNMTFVKSENQNKFENRVPPQYKQAILNRLAEINKFAESGMPQYANNLFNGLDQLITDIEEIKDPLQNEAAWQSFSAIKNITDRSEIQSLIDSLEPGEFKTALEDYIRNLQDSLYSIATQYQAAVKTLTDNAQNVNNAVLKGVSKADDLEKISALLKKYDLDLTDAFYQSGDTLYLTLAKRAELMNKLNENLIEEKSRYETALSYFDNASVFSEMQTLYFDASTLTTDRNLPRNQLADKRTQFVNKYLKQFNGDYQFLESLFNDAIADENFNLNTWIANHKEEAEKIIQIADMELEFINGDMKLIETVDDIYSTISTTFKTGWKNQTEATKALDSMNKLLGQLYGEDALLDMTAFEWNDILDAYVLSANTIYKLRASLWQMAMAEFKDISKADEYTNRSMQAIARDNLDIESLLNNASQTAINLFNQQIAYVNQLLGTNLNADNIVQTLRGGGSAAVNELRKIAQLTGKEYDDDVYKNAYRNHAERLVSAIEEADKITVGSIVGEELGQALGESASQIAGTNQYVVTSIENIPDALKNLYDQLNNDVSTTLEELNKAAVASTAARLNVSTSNVNGVSLASGMTLDELAELATQQGKLINGDKLGELIDSNNAMQVFETIGNGKLRVTNFARYAKLFNLNEDTEAYWDALNEFNEDRVGRTEKYIDDATNQVKDMLSKPGKSQYNLTKLAQKYESLRDLLDNGILRLADGENIFNAVNYILEQIKTDKEADPELVAMLQDAITKGQKTFADLIINGFTKGLTQVEVNDLNKYLTSLGVPNLAPQKTIDGYKIAQSDLEAVYLQLRKSGQDEIAERLLSTITKEYDTIEKAQARINELKRQGNKASAEELQLANEIAAAMQSQSGSFKFMDTGLTNPYQSPVDAYENFDKLFSVMREGNTNGYVAVQDFRNLINTIGMLAETSGKPIDILGTSVQDMHTASELIQEGFNAFKTIDGEGVIDLQKLGQSFDLGAADFQTSITAGIKDFAESQVQLLTAIINFLEMLQKIQDLELDTNADGIFNFSDIFNTETKDNKWDITSEFDKILDKLKEYGEGSKAVKEAFENIKEGNISLWDLITERDWSKFEGQITPDDIASMFKYIDIMRQIKDWDPNNILELEQYSSYENWKKAGQPTEPNLRDKEFSYTAYSGSRIIKEAPERAVTTDETGNIIATESFGKILKDLEAAGKDSATIADLLEKAKTSFGIDLTQTYFADHGLTGADMAKQLAEAALENAENLQTQDMYVQANNVEVTTGKNKGQDSDTSDDKEPAIGSKSEGNDDDQLTPAYNSEEHEPLHVTIDESNIPGYADASADIAADGHLGLTTQLKAEIDQKEDEIVTLKQQVLAAEEQASALRMAQDELEDQVTTLTEQNANLSNYNNELTANYESQLAYNEQLLYEKNQQLIAAESQLRELKTAYDDLVRSQHKTLTDEEANLVSYFGKTLKSYNILGQNVDFLSEVDTSSATLQVESALNQMISYWEDYGLPKIKTDENGLGLLPAIKSWLEKYGNDQIPYTSLSSDNNANQEQEAAQQNIADTADATSELEAEIPDYFSAVLSLLEQGEDKRWGWNDNAFTDKHTYDNEKINQATLDFSNGLKNLLSDNNIEINDTLMTALNTLADDSKDAGDKMTALQTVFANLPDILEKVTNGGLTANSSLENMETALTSLGLKVNNLRKSINNVPSGTKYVTLALTIIPTITGNGTLKTATAHSSTIKTTTVKKGTSKAKGTLMGELGPELVVSGGRYFLVGQNGAEFVNLEDDAIVFNHLQTASLMKRGTSSRGKVVTNERNATSFAKGNANGGPAKASIQSTIDSLKEIRNLWQAIAEADPSKLGQKAGGGGGGGGGGGNQLNLGYIADLERWYNLLRQIARLEKEINYEEQLRSKIQSDRVINGKALYASQKRSLDALDQEIARNKELSALQKDYYEHRRKDLAESPFGNIFTFDENGLMQYNDQAKLANGDKGGLFALAKINATTAEGAPVYSAKEQYELIKSWDSRFAQFLDYDDQGKQIDLSKKDGYTNAVKAFWNRVDGWKDELDDLYDSYHEQLENVLKNEDARNQLLQEIIDNQLSVEQEILDAIEAREQAIIDNLQDQRDALSDASDKFIDGLKNELDKERKMYQRNEEDADLSRLQRQLLILQRSGGSASQIRDLQNQITEKQRDKYFNTQEDQINTIKDASDKQIERLDAQIKLMQETLNYQKENGLLWNEVTEIMKQTPEQIISFIQMYKPQYRSDSELQINENLRELRGKVEAYVGYREDQDKKSEQTHNWDNYVSAFQKYYEKVWTEENVAAARAAFEKEYAISADPNKAGEAANAVLGNFLEVYKQTHPAEFNQTVPVSGSGATETKPSSGGGGGGGSGGGGSSSTINNTTTTTNTPRYNNIQVTVKHMSGSNLLRTTKKANMVPGEYKNRNFRENITGYELQNPNNVVKLTGNRASVVIQLQYKYVAQTTTQMNSNKSKLDALSESARKAVLGYSSGGLVEQTGPAMLHGTKTRPELVLNAEETQMWRKQILGGQNGSLVNTLLSLNDMTKNMLSAATSRSETTNNNGVVIQQATVELNASIASDYDARRAGELVMEEMLKTARKTGVNGLTRR